MSRHLWTGGGSWLSSYCQSCKVDEYDPLAGSSCEEYELNKKNKQIRIEKKKEAADFARTVLTREQWELLSLDKQFGEYRAIDRITI